MTNVMHPSLRHSFVILLTVVSCVAVAAARVAPAPRTINVSVLDKGGRPVPDLSDVDVVVKEGGAVRQIVGFQPATNPVRVAVIVADGGSGVFQRGIGRFLSKVLPLGGACTLISVIEQPTTVLDYTDDVPAVVAGLTKMSGGATQQGAAQVVEAIYAALAQIRHDGQRSVILVLRRGNEAASTLSADVVREALRQSGATMYVVSPVGVGTATGGASGGVGVGGDNISVARSQMVDSGMADRAMNLSLVFEDGSRDSGGRSITVGRNNIDQTLEALGTEIAGQYEITYLRPDGAPPVTALSVTTARKDVKVYAASRIPN